MARAYLLPEQPSTTLPPVDLETVRPLLRGLDREQRRAVTHGDGPLLILAGPGTGKTEVVTRRIAWLIATRRARPSEILALTFTERAAAEMQARVDMLVPYGRADAAIHTFHAFGDRILREHAAEAGLPAEPRVLSRPEGELILREELFRLGLRRYLPLGDPERNLRPIADWIARAKDAGLVPSEIGARVAALRASAAGRPDAEALVDDAEGLEELARAWERYEAVLRERGLLDFGDQVLRARLLLRDRPGVAARVADRFRHVLVDEGQDASAIQLDLVRAIARHGNLTVVGDDDQAIYGFRGAAEGGIARLATAFPGMRRIVLRRSYRSRRPILVAAHRLIRANGPERLAARAGVDRPLVAVRRGRRPAPVTVQGWPTDAAEADGVADAIARRVAEGAPARDHAVLVRTNGDGDRFVRALAARGLATWGSDGGRLGATPEVRELVSLLRLALDPSDDLLLYGVATAAPWRLGGSDLSRLLAEGRRDRRGLRAAMDAALAGSGLALAPGSHAAVSRLVRELDRALEEIHRRPAGDVLYGWLRGSGRYAVLVAAAEKGDDRPLRRVARLFEILRSVTEVVPDARAAVLLPRLQELLAVEAEEAEDADPQPDAVAVLTVHKAKGLEFPVVYLPGLADGRFPARRRAASLPAPAGPMAEDEADPLAEERRLCYVALTRARDALVLSWATASGGSGSRVRRPSPFLAEATDRPVRLPAAAGIDALRSAIEAVVTPTAMDAPEAIADDGRPLSASRVEDQLACPLRYHLRHRLGVASPEHHALVVGQALHEAAAAWHRATLAGEEPADGLLRETLDAHWRSAGFLSREHEDARYAAALATLDRFRADESTAAASGSGRRVVAVEEPFAETVAGLPVRGRFDRIDEGPDGIVIVDYKSGEVRDPRKAAERARGSFQLHLYALAWEARTGELPAWLELRFLDGGVVGRVRPEPARLEKARSALREAAAGIAAGGREPAPDPFACGHCPYREICPASAA